LRQQAKGAMATSDVVKNKTSLVYTKSIAATTKTDANGNYSFSFPNDYPFGNYGDVVINTIGINASAGGQLQRPKSTNV
jgi:hypothetical protein